MLKNLELETVLYGIPCFVHVISIEPFKYEIYSKRTSGRLDSLESLLKPDDVELLRIKALSLFPELETSTASLKTKILTENTMSLGLYYIWKDSSKEEYTYVLYTGDTEEYYRVLLWEDYEKLVNFSQDVEKLAKTQFQEVIWEEHDTVLKRGICFESFKPRKDQDLHFVTTNVRINPFTKDSKTSLHKFADVNTYLGEAPVFLIKDDIVNKRLTFELPKNSEVTIEATGIFIEGFIIKESYVKLQPTPHVTSSELYGDIIFRTNRALYFETNYKGERIINSTKDKKPR